MGHRLSKIVTRTGDDGTTGLGDGTRYGKDSLRIQVIGDVDELNAQIGVLLCEELLPALHAELLSIQHDLFDLGGELCIPGTTIIGMLQVARLEGLIVRYNAGLPPLKNFILPGGSRSAALAHVCRTVCRRAERGIVHLGKSEKINSATLQFMNRLSDLLFILSRTLNRLAGKEDMLWDRQRTSET